MNRVTEAIIMDKVSPLESMEQLHKEIEPMVLPTLAELQRPEEAGALANRRVRDGKMTPIVPDEEVYVGLFDTEKMNVAYKVFMSGGSIEDAATAINLPQRTVAKWVAQGGWVMMRDEVERAANDDERQRTDALRREKRLPELEKQIEAGQRLRERVSEVLDDDSRELKPGELKMLGDALKAAGDNTVRALGVSESGSTGQVEEEKGRSAKAPLVVLIQGGGLPPVRMQ